jgi:hypothetical protein
MLYGPSRHNPGSGAFRRAVEEAEQLRRQDVILVQREHIQRQVDRP